MQDADSMPSLLLTACVLSKSVQYTYNCPPGTLRRLDMQRLEESLGRGRAVLQTCKVPASRAATRLGLQRSTTCRHKRSTLTRLYHARVSDMLIQRKSFLIIGFSIPDSRGRQKVIDLLSSLPEQSESVERHNNIHYGLFFLNQHHDHCGLGLL